MDHPPFYVTYKYPMGYILGIGRFQELIYMACTLYLVLSRGLPRIGCQTFSIIQIHYLTREVRAAVLKFQFTDRCFPSEYYHSGTITNSTNSDIKCHCGSPDLIDLSLPHNQLKIFFFFLFYFWFFETAFLL